MAFPSLQSWTFPLWIHVEAECRCGSVAITRNRKAQQSLYFTYEAQGWNWRQSYSIFNFVSWFFCLFPMKTFWHVPLGRSYRPVKAIFFSCFAKWEMSPIYLHLLNSTTASLFVCFSTVITALSQLKKKAGKNNQPMRIIGSMTSWAELCLCNKIKCGAKRTLKQLCGGACHFKRVAQ